MATIPLSGHRPGSACRFLGALLLGVALTGGGAPTGLPLGAQEAPAPSAASRLLRAGDLDTLPLRQSGLRIAYGADSLQFGDLRLPPGLPGGERAPVAIVIHGGCWISSFATLRNTAGLADALAAQGVATWNIEYRRSDHPGGGWTGTFDDVARAAAYLRPLARLHPIDTTRVVTVGHSAGGHLALWLASRATTSFGDRTPPLGLAGAVSLGGVTDLEEFAQRTPGGCGRGATALLGGAPSRVPERVRLASPVRLLPLGVPTVHVAGDRDQIAPESVREAYRAAAETARDRAVRNITVTGGHFEVIAPATEAGRAAIDATLRLLGHRPR